MRYKYPLINDESEEAIRNSIKNARITNQDIYDKHRQKLKDFYDGNQTEAQYLGDYGFVDLKTHTYFTDLPWASTNITKQVIERISMSYKEPPTRTVITKNGDEIEDDALNQMIDEHTEFNIYMRELEHRYNLLDNVLFRPIYDADNKQFLFFIETDFTPFFKEGDPLHPVAYDIPVKMDYSNPVAVNEQMYLFVNDEYYFYHTGNGVPIVDDNLGDIYNPYKIMPLIDYSSAPVEDYWNLGAKGLVEGNQVFNIQLMNALYAFHFQCFDQPWVTGGNMLEVGKLQMGPKKVMVGPEGAAFGLLSYSTNFQQLADWMLFQLNMALNPYNVTANWEDSGNVASGVALKIKNMPLLENREAAIKHFRIKEYWLYEVLKTMINYHSKDLGYKKLPEDSKIRVDFVEPDFPIEPREYREEIDWKVSNNYMSKIDVIMELNPDLTKEEAEQRYQQILEDNRTLRGLGTPGATENAILEGLEE